MIISEKLPKMLKNCTFCPFHSLSPGVILRLFDDYKLFYTPISVCIRGLYSLHAKHAAIFTHSSTHLAHFHLTRPSTATTLKNAR
jgi:hypothetical protein